MRPEILRCPFASLRAAAHQDDMIGLDVKDHHHARTNCLYPIRRIQEDPALKKYSIF
jgi:hypothetical protein